MANIIRSLDPVPERLVNLLKTIGEPKKFPFRVSKMIGNLPLVSLQTGDTIEFSGQVASRTLHNGNIIHYLLAKVNGVEGIVSWSDLSWYRSYHVNDPAIPKCDVLEQLFPRRGEDVNFEFLLVHKFVVSGFCDLQSYVFNDDGQPQYVHKIIDGKDIRVHATFWYRKPMFNIL